MALLAASGAACGNGAGETQEQQVSQGAAVYQDECARCHDPGGIGPPLRAANLAAYGTADSLVNYIRRTMPQDSPGSLSDEAYWDVSAHLLASEDLLPEDTVLGPETASEIALND